MVVSSTALLPVTAALPSKMAPHPWTTTVKGPTAGLHHCLHDTVLVSLLGRARAHVRACVRACVRVCVCVCVCVCVGGRGERGRVTEYVWIWKTETETTRGSERGREGEGGRERDREREREKGGETDRERETETEREVVKYRNLCFYIFTYSETEAAEYIYVVDVAYSFSGSLITNCRAGLTTTLEEHVPTQTVQSCNFIDGTGFYDMKFEVTSVEYRDVGIQTVSVPFTFAECNN